MTDLAINPITEPEIDSELLEEAQRQISAPFPNSAINEALSRLVLEERAKRAAARDRMRQMHDEGVFDYSKLEAAEE